MNNFWEVQRALQDNLPGVTNLEKRNHSISFILTRRIGDISVDLLPAFEINGPRQIMEVKNRDSYYGSTSLLQNKYFKNVSRQYPRFADLVRLLKLWRNVHHIPLRSYML